MMTARYPGDQDPSNLEFAEHRRFIKMAINDLDSVDQKVIKQLLESPFVDGVSVRFDNKSSNAGTQILIVLCSGLWELSWIAFRRPIYAYSALYAATPVFVVRKTGSGRRYTAAFPAAEAFLESALLNP